MRRAAIALVPALALAMITCGGGSDTADDEPADGLTKERYSDLMRAHTDTLVKDFEAWAKTDFETQAEAGEALMLLTPVSARSRERLRALLAEHGVKADEVAAFIKEHPEAVDRATKAMQARFDEAMERLKPSFARIDELPRGDMQAAYERSLGMLERAGPAGAPSPAVAGGLDGWTAITSRDDLIAATAAALREDAPVIVHVRAEWALPTVKLEREVFPDEQVAAKLADYRRLFVDVSEGHEEHDELQKLLGAETLPWVQVWTDSEALATGMSSGELPPPDVRIDRLVTPDVLVDMVP